MPELSPLEWALLVPVVVGCGYALACWAIVSRYLAGAGPAPEKGAWPPVSILKPVHGLEKDLYENILSACELDYPEYQLVLSVQRLADPALPLLRAIEREYPDRVTVVAIASEPVVNGKVQNMIGALSAARHDVLVISDSDIRLSPDYLRHIVAPLADPAVGCVSTLYRAVGARSWPEKLEQLSYNSEFIVNVIFAKVTGAYEFCAGASAAVRRKELEAIGGFEALLDYLVEDFELGRRVKALGYRNLLVPHFVDNSLDVASAREWWNHQVYWDQNTRAANPIGFFCTFLIQPLPFALLFALVRGFDALGCAALLGTLAIRVVTRAGIFSAMGDREGLRMLGWLPLRDLAGFVSWAVACVKRSFVWRDLRFELNRDGRIVPRET